LNSNATIFEFHAYTLSAFSFYNVPHYFRIVESGVSQACRRVKHKIRKDKKLERKISKIEKRIEV